MVISIYIYHGIEKQKKKTTNQSPKFVGFRVGIQ